jgi:hypothetical protein
MKTLNLLMLCTMIIMVSASCVKEDPYQGPIYLANQHVKEIQVRAELYGKSLVIENGYMLEICGECFCNRGCKSSVYISGAIDLDTIDKSFKIIDGKFELTVENKLGLTDILDGEIQENHGSLTGNLFKITGSIKVGCGTGCLYANDDELNFIIEGTIGKAGAQSTYKIDISGPIS